VAKGLLPYHGLGSGIKRALTLWPQIDFADDREGCLFVATVHRHAPLSNLQGQLLKLVQSDPTASYDQLAALTEKDRTTIMRNMAKLKLAGKVQRVGAKKSGHWEVFNEISL
jgi:ATP-dependent DNA helicase RecG